MSRSTVQNIMRESGVEPTPNRKISTWREFIQTHLETLIACDFFTKEIWTWRGKATVYVFFFIELGTRRVHLAGITRHPKRQWVERCGSEVLSAMKESGFQPRYLIRDRDGKFSEDFDSVFEKRGVEVKKTPRRSPICNVYAERFVFSAKHECLNFFTVFGRRHLKYLVETYFSYYNRQRPHQGIGNVPVSGLPAVAVDGEIERVSILGGLHNYYQMKAA